MRNLEIPWNEGELFAELHLSTICVDNWFSNKLPELINKQISPLGWKFKSHTIKERDSFGPVTSELVLIDSDGLIHKGLI